MGLERVHRTDNQELFGPVRLGPQDLRDLAAVFDELDSKVERSHPAPPTLFRVQEHQTEDIEDVLGFADADTLPGLHIISGDLRLSFHAGQDGTIIDQPVAPKTAAHHQGVEEAAGKLRKIVQSRQLKPFQALRQRGPGWGLLVTLLAVPALALAVGTPLLALWFTRTTSQAVSAVIVWLSLVLLLLVVGRPKHLIRLRGRELPWWERRQGLIALVGVVLAVVIPVVIFALERVQD